MPAKEKKRMEAWVIPGFLFLQTDPLFLILIVFGIIYKRVPDETFFLKKETVL